MQRTSLPFLLGIRAREKGSVVLSWVLQAKELYPCASAQGFFQPRSKAVEISCSSSCVGVEGLPQHQHFPSGCLFEFLQVLSFCSDHTPASLYKHGPTVIPRVLSPPHTGHLLMKFRVDGNVSEKPRWREKLSLKMRRSSFGFIP